MWKNFVGFLEYGKPRKIAFEIQWPLTHKGQSLKYFSVTAVLTIDKLILTSPHTEAGDSAVFFMTNSAKWNLRLTQPSKNLWPTGAGRNINHDLLSQVLTYVL